MNVYCVQITPDTRKNEIKHCFEISTRKLKTILSENMINIFKKNTIKG